MELNVDFVGATSKGISFAGARFAAYAADGSMFRGCDFSRTSWDAAILGVGVQSTYVDCTFEGADLHNLDLGNARFERCTFHRAVMRGWYADAAEFIDCEFVGRISDCTFAGRPIGRWAEPRRLQPARATNTFRGNDFMRAELVGCDFVYGIDIAAQRWPGGPDYVRLDQWPERVTRARQAVAAWPPAEQKDAQAILDIYSRDGYDEQAEVFVDKYNLGFDRAVVDRTWHIVASVLP